MRCPFTIYGHSLCLFCSEIYFLWMFFLLNLSRLIYLSMTSQVFVATFRTHLFTCFNYFRAKLYSLFPCPGCPASCLVSLKSLLSKLESNTSVHCRMMCCRCQKWPGLVCVQTDPLKGNPEPEKGSRTTWFSRSAEPVRKKWLNPSTKPADAYWKAHGSCFGGFIKHCHGGN